MKCDDVKSAYSDSLETVMFRSISFDSVTNILVWYLKHKNYFTASGETHKQTNSCIFYYELVVVIFHTYLWSMIYALPIEFASFSQLKARY